LFFAALLSALVGPGEVLGRSRPLPPPPAGVQVTSEYGIEFSTVCSPGNSGYPVSTINWTGVQNERQGRGVVDYQFRIARTEVTTGQWLEFLNTFAPRPMPANIRALVGGSPNRNFIGGPSWWGAGSIEYDPIAGTERYALYDIPNAADVPVWGISWRMAAMYCNWLHNDKSSEWTALTSGAYDAGTWTFNNITGYRDDLNHLPGARFYIPSLDEWGKAAFYDPNRYGQGQGGWWNRTDSSDDLPTPGFPGEPGATTSAGILGSPVFGESGLIPLGAYPGSQSPWGLLDTSSGAQEVVSEEINGGAGFRIDVLALGGAAGGPSDPRGLPFYLDGISRAFTGGTTSFPSPFDSTSLRLAAPIPLPGTAPAVLAGCLWTCLRQRRRAT
jgi:hypothetical protein